MVRDPDLMRVNLVNCVIPQFGINVLLKICENFGKLCGSALTALNLDPCLK